MTKNEIDYSNFLLRYTSPWKWRRTELVGLLYVVQSFPILYKIFPIYYHNASTVEPHPCRNETRSTYVNRNIKMLVWTADMESQV